MFLQRVVGNVLSDSPRVMVDGAGVGLRVSYGRRWLSLELKSGLKF